MSNYTLEEVMTGLSADVEEPKAKTNGHASNNSLEQFEGSERPKTEFEQLNSNALANLDMWVPKLFPAATRRSEDKGWRVTSADLGRDLEEDLSIAPNGIKDFGTHDLPGDPKSKYTPIDLVMEANGCDFKAAVRWLCQAMGVEPIIKADPPKAKPAEPLVYVDMSEWDDTPAPRREWAVDGLIPMYQPHLTTGHGSMGKSLAELMRGVSHVLGKQWLGFDVKQGPVIYLSAEDEADEFHRRLECILKHHEASFKDIVGKLHLLTYADKDCLLAVPDRNGLIQPTDLFDLLMADALRLQPVAAIIDTLTDVYAGDEIDRSQTTQFIKLMQRMAMRCRCSTTIIAHPSNAGLQSGSGISGSTGWHNKVRSRMYLRAPETKDGEPIDSDLRELRFMKNNYGKQGDAIKLRWKEGVFIREPASGSFESAERDGGDETAFGCLLNKRNNQNRPVTSKPRANNYAPTVFLDDPAGKEIGKARLAAAMNRLFEKGKIAEEPYGKPSRGWSRLVLKSEDAAS
jgi:RecA-family ATPase